MFAINWNAWPSLACTVKICRNFSSWVNIFTVFLSSFLNVLLLSIHRWTKMKTKWEWPGRFEGFHWTRFQYYYYHRQRKWRPNASNAETETKHEPEEQKKHEITIGISCHTILWDHKYFYDLRSNGVHSCYELCVEHDAYCHSRERRSSSVCRRVYKIVSMCYASMCIDIKCAYFIRILSNFISVYRCSVLVFTQMRSLYTETINVKRFKLMRDAIIIYG